MVRHRPDDLEIVTVDLDDIVTVRHRPDDLEMFLINM